MNHLHNVIDAILSGECGIQDFVLDDDAIFKTFMLNASKAICFDAGDAMDVFGISGIPELVRLPYECCWIEASTLGSVVGALCMQRNDRIVAIPALRNGCTWILGESMGIERVGDLIGYRVPPQSEEWHKTVGSLIARFLSALNCSNVRSVETPPPSALNKARVRRGKQPLFSTWTLLISIQKDRRDSVALGGTHASPRVHLRRGHPREYRPGLWTWVQPCAVGAKENGMVHKDYRVVTAAQQ